MSPLPGAIWSFTRRWKRQGRIGGDYLGQAHRQHDLLDALPPFFIVHAAQPPAGPAAVTSAAAQQPPGGPPEPVRRPPQIVEPGPHRLHDGLNTDDTPTLIHPRGLRET